MAPTTMDADGSEFTVKNTFIHVGAADAAGAGRLRALRRWQTDAGESSTGGTPEELLEETRCALGDRRLVESPFEESLSGETGADMGVAIATPEHTPRHVSDVCAWMPPPWPVGNSSPEQLSRSAASPPPTPMGCPTTPGQHIAQIPGGSGFAFAFTFTLRLADEHGLGLELAPLGVVPFLTVRQVLPGGAMEAWNKQSLDNASSQVKAVRPGDNIVSVNGQSDCLSMFRECRERQLLKITIARVVPDLQSIEASVIGKAADSGIPRPC